MPNFIAERGSIGERLSGRKLPSEVVVADQRRRIAAALAQAVFERGYRSTPVTAIIEPAAISRRTFYDLYRDKADAFCAVHAAALDLLDLAVRQASAPLRLWPRKVEAAVSAGLRWAAANPPRAALLVVESLTAGPRLGYCHDLMVERFAPRLRRGRADAPAMPPPALEEMLLSGLAATVAGRLRAGRAEELPALAPQLTTFVVAPYLDRDRAGRLAR